MEKGFGLVVSPPCSSWALLAAISAFPGPVCKTTRAPEIPLPVTESVTLPEIVMTGSGATCARNTVMENKSINDAKLIRI